MSHRIRYYIVWCLELQISNDFGSNIRIIPALWTFIYFLLSISEQMDRFFSPLNFFVWLIIWEEKNFRDFNVNSKFSIFFMQKIRIIDPVEKFRHSVLFVFLFPFIFRISIRYIRHNRACEMSRYSSAQYSLYTCLVNQKNNVKRKFLCRKGKRDIIKVFVNIFSFHHCLRNG